MLAYDGAIVLKLFEMVTLQASIEQNIALASYASSSLGYYFAFYLRSTAL